MSDKAWSESWLSKSGNDLLAAERLFNDYNPKQLDISCYHCQQCAEKALKAYLIHIEQDFPYTHDLIQLCQLCSDFDNTFNELLDDCSDLTPYATQTRYPNNIEFEEHDASFAIQKAKKILTTVTEKINFIGGDR